MNPSVAAPNSSVSSSTRSRRSFHESRPVLARDDRLRVVEPERRAREIGVGMARERRQGAESRECVGVVGARGAQQIFRLPLELIDTWALG